MLNTLRINLSEESSKSNVIFSSPREEVIRTVNSPASWVMTPPTDAVPTPDLVRANEPVNNTAASASRYQIAAKEPVPISAVVPELNIQSP